MNWSEKQVLDLIAYHDHKVHMQALAAHYWTELGQADTICWG